VRPHPLFRRLADIGLELPLHGGGGYHRVGFAILRPRDRHALDADREMDVRASKGGAGIEGQAGHASEQGGKHVRSRRLAEEGHRRAAVVAEVREEGRITAFLRGAQERARGHRRLGQKSAFVEGRAHPARLGVDKRIGNALINPRQRHAHSLAGVGDDLPIAQVKPADHERAAAPDLIESLFRLEFDPVALDEFGDVKSLGESAAEVFPHLGRQLLPLRKRHLGESQGKVRERAFLPVKMRRDQPPELSGEPRSALDRHRPRHAFREPEAGVFEPVSQIFGDRHPVSARLSQEKGRPDFRAARAAVKDGRSPISARGLNVAG